MSEAKIPADPAAVTAIRVVDLLRSHNGDMVAVAVDLIIQLDRAIGVLRDYPAGRDDGTWLRRRAESILLAQKTGAVPA